MSQNHTLITGAASGIGAAVAAAASQEADSSVCLTDINVSAGEALAETLGQTFAPLDVSSLTSWQDLAAQYQPGQGPNRLFLNAGIQIAPPSAPLEEYEFLNLQLERYRTMMSVNVDGVVFGLLTLIPTMPEGSAIVVTASLAGVTPYAVDPLYAMSKHAVVGLVRSLAPSCKERGIRINAICPGGVETNIVPHEQRSADIDFMSPDVIAQDVMMLFDTETTGKTWVKVATNKPAWIIRAPGDKS